MDTRKVVGALEFIHDELQAMIDEDIASMYVEGDAYPPIRKPIEEIDHKRIVRAGRLARALARLNELWDELDELVDDAPPAEEKHVIPTPEMLEAWKAAATTKEASGAD